MDKRAKIIIGLFVTVLLGIVITEIVRPKPLDWRPSYTASDKIPFGCFVLYNELENLFPNQKIGKVDESLYNLLASRDSTEISNFIFINDGISFDRQEGEQLLRYVAQGNDVFIAASSFGTFLSDTLNLEVFTEYSLNNDSISVTLTHKEFNKKQFHYTKGSRPSYFISVDTLNTTLLGYVAQPSEKGKETLGKHPNFINTSFGKGQFYLSTAPQAFSNYYLLHGNSGYVSHALSYLADRPLLWDNYKKSGRAVINSPLRFVLTRKALKWAYYLCLIGILLFVLFRGKRQQRIIPVLTPLENASVNFAQTVGSLYYQHRNPADLIKKKLNYFQEYIRSRYQIDINTISAKTAIDLAAISGHSVAETRELLDSIVFIRNKKGHTMEDLVGLHKKITAFKN